MMIKLLDGDERVKISVFIVLLFLIQSMVLYGIMDSMISQLNQRYINQNIAIVGEVYSIDKGIGEEIIPIITGKTEGNYDLGSEVMKRYSYKEDLKVDFNPLFQGIKTNYFYLMVITVSSTLVLALMGIIILINPMYKEIFQLTKRAEEIVENKFQQVENYSYKGSLDKFVFKFNGMEDRIRNNIGLLQEEKINLKNIINDISHQLKTPLMALSMYNEIIKEYKTMEEEDIDNFINLSKEQLERMEWLVKTLLKYARLESNVVEYHKEYLPLENTIEECLNPLKSMAEEKNQSLTLKTCKNVFYYHDRAWICEAISNIVKNAIEHTDYNGRIEITLEETPLSIVISIKDNGEGINKGELKKIFKRFHKGENALNPASIGIGLCLSKAIIQDHNGDITVESELGVGSVFYITFLKNLGKIENKS